MNLCFSSHKISYTFSGLLYVLLLLLLLREKACLGQTIPSKGRLL